MLQDISSPSRTSASTPPTDRPTEEELRALRAQDPEAIERWVYGSRDIVYPMLLKMVKDPDVAQELLQETFYQALVSIKRFRGDAKVSTWMCSIARNLTFRHFRTQDRYTTAESNTLEWMSRDRRPTDSASDFEAHPRHHTERRERKAMVHRALAQLSESYREVIRMRDLEEKSTQEVADALDLSRVNVRVRLHRARRRLESILRAHLRGAPEDGGLAVAA